MKEKSFNINKLSLFRAQPGKEAAKRFQGNRKEDETLPS
jgi:hypothetical protein